MSREWKTGQSAMATTPSGEEFLVVRIGHGDRGYWSAPNDWPRGVSDYECTFRPLVVIDPENRDQVERLVAHDAFLGEYADASDVADMQAVLREFANPKPPKPEEPKGWGAVVEDDTGALWTLYAPEAGTWINYREGKRLWDGIDAVRIVGEGVQP